MLTYDATIESWTKIPPGPPSTLERHQDIIVCCFPIHSGRKKGVAKPWLPLFGGLSTREGRRGGEVEIESARFLRANAKQTVCKSKEKACQQGAGTKVRRWFQTNAGCI